MRARLPATLLLLVIASEFPPHMPWVIAGAEGGAATRSKPDAAKAALDRVTSDREFSRVPLSNAISELRAECDANIFVNWRALENAGIRRETPVTVTLRGRTLSDALDVLMTVAAPHRGGWAVTTDDGMIVVTTTADLATNVSVRVYDVRELIGSKRGEDQDLRIHALVRLLEDQIDPPSWKDHGGSSGAIRELQGQLIVTQTDANQERVAKLLTDVRGVLPNAHPVDGRPLPTSRSHDGA